MRASFTGDSAVRTTPNHYGGCDIDTKFKVDFEPLGKRVEVKAGLTVLDAARQAGLPLTSDCGGYGSCGQCLVIVRDQQHVGPVTLTEEQLTGKQLAAGYRMACQVEVLGDVKVDVPHSSLISGQRLQVESSVNEYISGSFEDLVVQAYQVSVAEASLHDSRGDLERVTDVMAAEYDRPGLSASLVAVRSLPDLLRKHGWQVTVVVRGDVIIGFLAPGLKPVGLAVDLGTTKVAAFLVDLTSGETLAAEGRPNPQIGYGEDVISRLVYAKNKPEGAQTLSQAVYSTLAELAGVSRDQIAEACIVGNMAMMHLLLELPVSQLAVAPYVSAASHPMEIRAVELGLDFLGDARVYTPPCVAGFVGSDLVAMTLASGIGQDDRTVLGIDIGTNTEIVLSQKGTQKLVSLSCASGPAFEGAHIRAGMRAAAGAIEQVHLDGGDPVVKTIDDLPAVGICGSGIIDAVAELYRTGVINSKGRFQGDTPGVRRGTEGWEYLLVPASASGSGEDITVTQHDVDEIQLAKGAIMAGIHVLLEITGLSLEDLDEVVLAGAFGTYLNLDTSTAIGLLPNVPLERYRQVGNAAGDGARRMLFSRAARARAMDITQRIDYVELSVYPRFQRIYAKSMLIER